QRIATEHCWREARKTSNFALFLPEFKKMLALTREEATAKSAALNLSPYDAMLDSYDSGLCRAMIDPVFADLKSWLPQFVTEVIDHQARVPSLPLDQPIPTEQQKNLGLSMMQRLGFDMSQGRIDSSTHPFCGGVPGDVRITTRYDPNRFMGSLYGVMHETGHALYEQGLPEAWRGLPVGVARGMSVHESQSLFVEMQLGRSAAFLRFLAPQLAQHFGVSGAAWTAENLQLALTRVTRSFIRVDADEVTYPLHVILRYELEQALLSGDLPPEDLPGAWAEKMQQYLGITPPDDAQGCLQDIHWPEGMIGYFPTYTLGAMLAAQLMAAARRTLTDLDVQLESGEFSMIIKWLKT
ncbi:MAG: carboxypeptidase M32, partial [Rhodospirillales bacterium 12-54-5]